MTISRTVSMVTSQLAFEFACARLVPCAVGGVFGEGVGSLVDGARD